MNAHEIIERVLIMNGYGTKEDRKAEYLAEAIEEALRTNGALAETQYEYAYSANYKNGEWTYGDISISAEASSTHRPIARRTMAGEWEELK